MKRIFFVLFVLLIYNNVYAAEISVRADIDSSSLLIGNPANLRFSVSQPVDKWVQFPIFADTIVRGVEIIEKKMPDTLRLANNRIEVRQDYVVSVFDSGEYKISPVKFVLDKDTFAANALMLKGVTVPVDTVSKAFRDIKPIMEVPFDWAAFFIYAGIILLILAVLAAIIYFIIKKIKNKPTLPSIKPEVIIPAHITALQALDKIKAEKLWQHGREKDFHTQLTDTLRTYIEVRFGINAMEMTSDDILQHLKQQSLKQVLQTADLVKFAKQKMLPNENDLCLENAYSFINETKEEV